ncbi:hypothetical protein EKK58_05465 [Candidatus Dependentiae bacterium]|nr:MAG: hypothetical protein EKK58_05465 [Candidatus Dependentiae bacterium]
MSATKLFLLEGRLVQAAKQLCAVPVSDPDRARLENELRDICDNISGEAPLDLHDETKCLVRWLHANAFDSTERDPETAVGHVLLVVDPADAVGEAIRLRDLLAAHAVQLAPYGSDAGGTHVLQTFDAVDGSGLIEVLNLDDARMFFRASV